MCWEAETGNDGSASIAVHGNIMITSYDSIQVAGGAAGNSTAEIFALDPGNQITLDAPSQDLNLQGGTGANSRAVIGTASGPIQLNNPDQRGGDLGLMGGRGGTSDATIQPGSGDFSGYFFGDIVMAGGESPGNGSANIIADGNVSLSGNSFQLFGNTGSGNNRAQIISNSGSATLVGTGSMQFLGQQVDNGNHSSVVFAKSISIKAASNITLDGAAYIHANTGDVLMIAGNNMSIGNHSQLLITNINNADMTLVVDNQEPDSPYFGPGEFNFLSGAYISSQGGPLHIFTSVRSQNTIEGTINGQTFVPGLLYVDSPTEQWGTYYDPDISFSGGEPFTFFYKDSGTNPSPGEPGAPVVGVPGGAENPFLVRTRNQMLAITRQSEIDDAQFFYATVDSTDDVLLWSIDFKLCYDLTSHKSITTLPPFSSSYQGQ